MLQTFSSTTVAYEPGIWYFRLDFHHRYNSDISSACRPATVQIATMVKYLFSGAILSLVS